MLRKRNYYFICLVLFIIFLTTIKTPAIVYADVECTDGSDCFSMDTDGSFSPVDGDEEDDAEDFQPIGSNINPNGNSTVCVSEDDCDYDSFGSGCDDDGSNAITNIFNSLNSDPLNPDNLAYGQSNLFAPSVNSYPSSTYNPDQDLASLGKTIDNIIKVTEDKNSKLSAHPNGNTGILTTKNNNDEEARIRNAIEQASMDAFLKAQGAGRNVNTGSSANIKSGNLFHSQDVGGLTLTYNSKDAYSGPLGRGWTHSFNWFLKHTGQCYYAKRGDGNKIMFCQEYAYNADPKSGDTSRLFFDETGETIRQSLNNGLTYRYSNFNVNNEITNGEEYKLDEIYQNNFSNGQNNLIRLVWLTYDGDDLTWINDNTGRDIGLMYDNGLITGILDTNYNIYEITYNDQQLLSSITDPQNGTWQFTYDLDGMMTQKTDPAGNITTYTYLPDGKLSTSTDAAGNSISLNYDSDNSLTYITQKDGGVWTYNYDNKTSLPLAITDPAGNRTSLIYDDSRRLIGKALADGTTRSMVYDYSGNLASVTDHEGNTTNFTYNSLNQITAVTDQLGHTTMIEYDRAGKMKSFSDANGALYQIERGPNGLISSTTGPDQQIHQYVYDDNNRLISKIDPTNGTTQYEYDHGGNITKVIDALGNQTEFSYNSLNKLEAVINAAGATTIYSHDAAGNLVAKTDPNGNTTSYDYNYNHKVTKVTDPLGNATQLTYGNGGCPACGAASDNLTSITDPNGNTTKLIYDLQGRITQRIDPLGNASNYTYDALGNLTAFTDASGNVTRNEYDSNGKLLRMTDPLGNTTSFIYDAKGNRVSSTDANGKTTRFSYDPMGRLIQVTDASGKSTIFGYNASGKLITVRDANGNTTIYGYDPAGRVTQTTDPLGKTTIYTYDAKGNAKTRTDANGATVTYTYDSTGSLKGKAYPDNTSIAYTYDAAGNLLGVAGPTNSYTYVYNAAGRLTNVTDSRGYTVSYDYDAAGNRTKMTLQPGTPDQRVTNYIYDSANRLTRTTSPAGNFAFTYDAVGRRKTLTYPNNIMASYTYDKAERLTGVTYASGTSTVASFNYTLDRVGNRTKKTAAEAELYLYDSLYQILSVTSGKPETFTYDAVGNRQSGPGAKDNSYLHNAGNQMLQGRKLQYGYDDNGNQATKSITGVFDKTWTQTWDYENRLVKVEKVKGADKITVTFSYDPTGRRIGKQVTTFLDGVTKTSSWAYVYDGQDIIMELAVNENGGMTKTFYTQGPVIDEHLALERNGQYYYYHADGLGSVVAITDISKAVVQSYEYDSFGMGKPSTVFANSYTYTGREWDKETGLYYYRARYYDPMEGRFISKDPIGFRGGINVYGYVKNNPLRYIDPSGLSGYSFSGFGVGGTAGPLDVSWNSTKPTTTQINVSTPQIGGGIKFCFSKNKPRDNAISNLNHNIGLGKFLGVSYSDDFKDISINVGLGLVPISWDTPMTSDDASKDSSDNSD